VKKKDFIKLQNNEVDDLIDEWEPESLVLPLKKDEKWMLDSIPVIESAISTHVKTATKSDVLNLASLNFLNFGINPKVKEESTHIIHQNGVGACGPPNFYGNQDIHIKLENDLTSFFGTEGAVLYGQDFTTAGSVLPSFLKRGDFVIADSNANLSIQKALQLSRASIYWFNHNDLEHLESILEELHDKFFKYEKKGTIPRKFIVSEGLFSNSGDYPDLPRLVELKKKFKFRLFLDESLSLGVLGKTGRGLTEHYNLPRSDVDITIGSMATALSSSGAFCIGDSAMSYHQRIGSLAYCFSASLPAYVARATSTALQLIDESVVDGESSILKKLHGNTSYLHKLITSDRVISKYFKVLSKPESCVVHLVLDPKLRESFDLPEAYTGQGSPISILNKKSVSDKFLKSLNQEEKLITRLTRQVYENGDVLLAHSNFSLNQEMLPLVPHLKICVNVDLSKDDLSRAYKVLHAEVEKLFKNLTKEQFYNLEVTEA
jgi:serine palmitoyltransferase